jgi:hypothetical protein
LPRPAAGGSFAGMRTFPVKVFLFGAIAVFVLTLGTIRMIPEQPVHPVGATVTRVTHRMGRFTIWAVAEFKADDGRTGSASFFANEFACHAGQRVSAEEVGINLRLHGSTCRRAAPNPWVR